MSVSTISPTICPEVMGVGVIIIVFWTLNFKLAFSFSTFIFIKWLFSYSLFPATRVTSSEYLRMLIFLSTILIPACDSFSLAFCMKQSACKLNKQGENIQPWRTLSHFDPVHCSISSSNCYFLTCIQVSQETGKVIWDFHLFKNFPQFVVIHSQRL